MWGRDVPALYGIDAIDHVPGDVMFVLGPCTSTVVSVGDSPVSVAPEQRDERGPDAGVGTHLGVRGDLGRDRAVSAIFPHVVYVVPSDVSGSD